jgi:DNA modification methylase
VRVTPYYTDPLATLLHGDCIEVMAGLEADSVDAVVTDPPYGLEFMGKEWDAFRSDDPGTNRHRGERAGGKGERGGAERWGNGDRSIPSRRTSYGGGERPKTNRCVGCGKRDQFRNPHSCPEGTPWKSELIDPYAAPPSSLAFQNWCRIWALAALRVTKPGGYLLAFGGTRTHHRLVCALEDAGWIIRDELDWIYASGFPKGKANLKPAREPIVLARKPGPLRPLGVDECRIPGAVPSVPQSAFNSPTGHTYGMKAGEGRNGEMSQADGRWPSNVLLSDPELFDEPNPYVVGSGATTTVPGNYTRSTDVENWGVVDRHMPGDMAGDLQPGYGDSGGYSRFFIVPKADRAERERGLAGRETPSVPTARANVHPTVKPIDLMRHLVRLVTPNGGTVLDPFLGSGTTALAASEEGFRCIGIEREAEYLEIARGRLMATPMGLGLE